MRLGEKIREYRKAAGKTQAGLAKDLGISYMTVRRWETGERAPSIEQIRSIASQLNTSIEELLDIAPQGGERIQNTRPVRGGVIEVPVLSAQCTACCGEGFALADIDPEILRYELIPEEWVSGPMVGRPLYIIYVEGDSMEPLIEDGERVLVNPNLEVTHGKIAVACWNGYTMIRGVQFKRNGDIILCAKNPAYKDIVIAADDAPQLLSWGGVVEQFLGRARPAKGFF